MNTFVLNTIELSFKEFLEIIHEQSGLTEDEFYKNKIVFIIPYLEKYNLVKKHPKIYYLNPIKIETNEDLQKSQAMLPILDSNIYYITKKNADFTYILVKEQKKN